MSISVSIYDLFAYTIPGFLYLFLLDELFRLFGSSYWDVSTTDFSKYWLPITLFAYLTGQIMDYVCHRLWTRIWYRVPSDERAYKKFVMVISKDKFDLNPKQWSLLLNMIRKEDHPTGEMLDRFIATSIMLRNISFGLILLALLNLYMAIQPSFSFYHIILMLGIMVFSAIALRRSDYFNLLFYSTIFYQAVLYGKDMQEVLSNVRSEKVKNIKAK
jgi:hypothetical protein